MVVKGLDRFREHFREYTDYYVLIGGTACSLVLDPIGAVFRSTKDFDIVLCIEEFNREFTEVFLDFVQKAGYEQKKRKDKHQRFCFSGPSHSDYPDSLELFSRVPDALDLAPGGEKTPIPTVDELSDLSAILLDDTYYEFLHVRKKVEDGLSYASAECLVPLKALAWLNNTKRKKDGERIDSKKITKHKNDVFRLIQALGPEPLDNIPDTIKADLRNFISAAASAPEYERDCLRLQQVYQLG